MGNDGGRYVAVYVAFGTPANQLHDSIPTRRELVKEAARNPSTTQVKETQKEQQEHYWTTDPISHQPLSLPIVSDCLGNLYSKDGVLEYLLAAGTESSLKSKTSSEDDFSSRLKSLRDVVEVRFQVEEEKEKGNSKASPLKLVCPITNKKLGPGIKAVYLVPCGHAFLESAVKEMSGEGCLQVSRTTHAW